MEFEFDCVLNSFPKLDLLFVGVCFIYTLYAIAIHLADFPQFCRMQHWPIGIRIAFHTAKCKVKQSSLYAKCVALQFYAFTLVFRPDLYMYAFRFICPHVKIVDVVFYAAAAANVSCGILYAG